ncbi:hypothetical protein ACIPW5_25570 [Streptomyces sp. NPDC090077]|uniref:hypothetical protein n=1 Tax=Streptomyces sp. NPDC090077 TaxID=3365938 RepID=UPI003830A19A
MESFEAFKALKLELMESFRTQALGALRERSGSDPKLSSSSSFRLVVVPEISISSSFDSNRHSQNKASSLRYAAENCGLCYRLGRPSQLVRMQVPGNRVLCRRPTYGPR